MKKIYTCAILFLGLWATNLQAQTNISLNSKKQNIVWKVRPQSSVGQDSINIFGGDYSTANWVEAQVPGTVFGSYVKAGLEKDPNYADNIYQVDKKKYNRNFWYRTQFSSDSLNNDKRIWLNFEGINRKGIVFFNGRQLGKLSGFMDRGKYNITSFLRDDAPNVLAVLVHCPQKPIPNYASPTYISSDGWDWMPSVPGLDMGITDDVYLSTSGPVTIKDPWVRSDLPSLDKAKLNMQVTLNNSSGKETEGMLKGTIQPGDITFDQHVKLGGNRKQTIHLDSRRFKQFVINNPKLWWPNGYGKPNLYHLNLAYEVDGKTSDRKQVTFGIREFSYDTTNNVFHIYVNGKRIFVRGGNWGMCEYMLRCKGTYDLRMKLHKDMHMNMIRNWIGSTTDEEFYEAADKYGIMIWDDFWLNSHPNLPRNVSTFNKNAVEKIKRYRNHPSIAVWCGDNEGKPLPPLNGWLTEDVKTFDGGDRWYQPNSHAGSLTGSGPWTNSNPQWYFTKYPNGFGGTDGWGFRTEIGTAVFPTFASFKKFIPKEDWWPRNEMWNKHFFGKSAANASPDHYMETIRNEYGKPTGIRDFTRKAQLLNIETNKALYEGWQHNMWNDASGVMTWMSQSAYPSMVWQTYDYYYDLTGAFWGVKKAAEPIHIQWSYADNSVKVINTTRHDYKNMHAKAIIYNLSGKKTGLGKSAEVNSKSNTAQQAFSLAFKTDNLAQGKNAVASTTSDDAGKAAAVTDGAQGSRWSSKYKDNQWIYIDLGKQQMFSSVVLNWEAAYARSYKIQVSDDAAHWKDVYTENDAQGGLQNITFKPIEARYVRMVGQKRATQYGFSLYEFEVYKKPVSTKPKVQFIRLRLKDADGNKLSNNFYWRSTRGNNYTSLNDLPSVDLEVSSSLTRKDEEDVINAHITNPASSKGVAFAVHVQAVRASDGTRILPAMMNDNYFTLMQGESKDIQITFDPTLLKNGDYKLKVMPYNNFGEK